MCHENPNTVPEVKEIMNTNKISNILNEVESIINHKEDSFGLLRERLHNKGSSFGTNNGRLSILGVLVIE